jgi:hypothetical protein
LRVLCADTQFLACNPTCTDAEAECALSANAFTADSERPGEGLNRLDASANLAFEEVKRLRVQALPGFVSVSCQALHQLEERRGLT